MTTLTEAPDDTAEVATLLHVTRRWIIEKSRAGHLPSHRLPGSNRRRFLLSEIEAAILARWEPAS